MHKQGYSQHVINTQIIVGVDNIAKYMGISESSLRKLIKENKDNKQFPIKRWMGKLRAKKENLDIFLDQALTG